ncbi:unnamed protein product [Phytomonas sp. EM1]|nr:unnamed protein product [Phytomonas sp. EM1]|eukprot:CCW64447.1 unnamed protein product [Phytomonas sp. isolate EM1]
MNLDSRNLPLFDNHYGHETLVGDWKESRDLEAMQAAIKSAGGRGPDSGHPAKPLSTMTLIMANAAGPGELSDKVREWANAGRSTFTNDFTPPQGEDHDGIGRTSINPVQPPKGLDRELIFSTDAGTVAVFEGQPTSIEYGLYLSNPAVDWGSVPEAKNPEAAAMSARRQRLCVQSPRTLYDTYQQLQDKGKPGSKSTAHFLGNREVSGTGNSSPRYLTDVAERLIAPIGKEQTGRVSNISESKTSGPEGVGAFNSSEETRDSDTARSEKCREVSMIATTHPLRVTTKRPTHHSGASLHQSTCFLTTKMSAERTVADSCFQRSLPPPKFPL